MRRLYDGYTQNKEGKELCGLISDATKATINEWLEDGFSAHDIERIASIAVTSHTLIWALGQCIKRQRRENKWISMREFVRN